MAPTRQPTIPTLLGYAIKRAQHALRVRLDQSFSEIGLTTPQYTALTFIETSEASSNADLARAGFVTPQTMHAILGGLESAGLVTRRPHPHHAKIVLVDLTAAGRDRLAAAHQLASPVEAEAFVDLDAHEQQRLRADLTRIADNLIDRRN